MASSLGNAFTSKKTKKRAPISLLLLLYSFFHHLFSFPILYVIPRSFILRFRNFLRLITPIQFNVTDMRHLRLYINYFLFPVVISRSRRIPSLIQP